MKRAAVCFATCVVLLLTVASVLRWHRNQVTVDTALRNISESCQVRIHTLGRSVDMEMTDGLKRQLTDAILNNLSFPMNFVKRAAVGRLVFLDSDGKQIMSMIVFSKNVVRIEGVFIELSVNALDICGVDARGYAANCLNLCTAVNLTIRTIEQFHLRRRGQPHAGQPHPTLLGKWYRPF